MKHNTLLALIMASAFAAPAFAQNTPRIDKREANQQRRIDQGVQSGALTAKETQNLQRREDKLNANEAKAKADGVVTPKERRQLHREENRMSHAIHAKKHNGRTAK
jgi:hypothetical protein